MSCPRGVWFCLLWLAPLSAAIQQSAVCAALGALPAPLLTLRTLLILALNDVVCDVEAARLEFWWCS